MIDNIPCMQKRRQCWTKWKKHVTHDTATSHVQVTQLRVLLFGVNETEKAGAQKLLLLWQKLLGELSTSSRNGQVVTFG